MLLFAVDHLLVESQPLVMQRVPKPVALGPQIGLVVWVRHVLDRDLVGLIAVTGCADGAASAV